MPTLRPNLRWLAAATAVLVAVGAVAWVLQRDDTDTTPTTRSTSDATSTPTAPSGEPVSSAPPVPTASATDGPAATPTNGTGSTGSTGGPTDGRSPGKVRGTGGRTGAPSGAACWSGSQRAPLSPVPGDATATEVRHQVGANLQLLREISSPPALSGDVEGLRSYYRRVGQVVGTDGRDGPLTPEDKDRVEQLTQDVYSKFASPVVDFLSHRC
jgi:hypothetical protein